MTQFSVCLQGLISMKYLLMASVAFTALTSGAQASAIVTSQTSTLPFSSTADFTAPTLTAITGTVDNNKTSSEPNVYRSPFDTTPYTSAAFSSAEGDATAFYNGTGNVFSLIWGSPDTYNQLSFYSGLGGTGSLIGTILGSAINPANGTGYSYVTVGTSATFESVVLRNDPNTNAFEVSTFGVSSVPLPASLPMFGGALLALGGLALLKKRSTKNAVAA